MDDRSTGEAQSRHVRIGRVLGEIQDRMTLGERIETAEVISAHPDLADDLREHLGLLRRLHRSGHNIHGLVAEEAPMPAADAAHDTRFGAYKTIDCIGRGGMGIVLKAHDENLNRTVAVKVLRPELADDQAALERFKREAEAASSLNHPNIITVHAVGEAQGVRYIVMEYVDGPTLMDVIRAHPAASHSTAPQPSTDSPAAPALSTDGIRDIFRQLLSGLAAAHAAGLLHRDIKPANLLLSRRRPDGSHDASCVLQPSAFQLKIADFGLARIACAQTRLTLTRSALGTAEYMSPEQARGDKAIDHRTDLYSAGVVLYEMLTGRTPFAGGSPSTVLHRILHVEPADPRTVNPTADPCLSALALRLMAKRPEDRLASAAEALTALNAGGRVRSPERRRKLRRRLAAGMTVVTLIGASTWLANGKRDVPVIQAVWIDQNDDKTILARYRDDGTPRPLQTFPAECAKATDVALVRLRDGAQVVAAGVAEASEGKCVYLYDARRELLHTLCLDGNTYDWPDCDSRPSWACAALAGADVDGEPGDELIVAAQNKNEHPARLSIIDSRTWQTRATFWHMGHWCGPGLLHIEPHFFADGHPAIVVAAVNNKLDGFHRPRPGDQEVVTTRDIVPVVMVLDPRVVIRQVDSIGPPRTARLPIQPADILAYAFLDTATTSKPGRVPGEPEPRAAPPPWDVASLDVNSQILPSPSPGGEARRWFQLQFQREGGKPACTLRLDANLELKEVLPSPYDPYGFDAEDWRKRWKVLIRNGEYIGEPRAEDGRI